MKINVRETTVARYTIEIDVAKGGAEKVCDELSSALCANDIIDIEAFLNEKGVHYITTEEDINSRIKVWR